MVRIFSSLLLYRKIRIQEVSLTDSMGIHHSGCSVLLFSPGFSWKVKRCAYILAPVILNFPALPWCHVKFSCSLLIYHLAWLPFQYLIKPLDEAVCMRIFIYFTCNSRQRLDISFETKGVPCSIKWSFGIHTWRKTSSWPCSCCGKYPFRLE